MCTAFFIAAKLTGALLRQNTWIILTVAILPLGDLLLQSIGRTYPAQPPLDGIIALGNGEDAPAPDFWGQTQINEGGERYMAAVELEGRFARARLLFRGGIGALSDVSRVETSEGKMAGHFFRGQGIASERLLLDGQSRNTAENARLSLDLASPAARETWVLVTSAFQMPRAMRSFEVAGWPELVSWQIDYSTSAFSDGVGWNLRSDHDVLNTAIREWVLQIAYRLSGR
jgi:uncharacterized SAM-binding protein YcdF (DUF218 family)